MFLNLSRKVGASDSLPDDSGLITSFDGNELYYEVRGQGQPLVIVNNFFMTASHWEPFTRRIRKAYKVITYDLRHQGQSARIDGPVAVADHVRDLEAVVKGLGLGQVSLMGTCISTLICRDFALAHPEQVRGLALAGPIFSPFGSLYRTFLHKSLLASLKAGGVDALFDHYYPLLYTARTIESNRVAGYLAIKTRFADNNPEEQLEKHLNSTISIKDDPELLKKVRPPVLLLCGEEDFLTSPQALTIMSKLIPDCRYQIIPMAGHNPYVEATAEFEDAVLSFLAPAEIRAA